MKIIQPQIVGRLSANAVAQRNLAKYGFETGGRLGINALQRGRRAFTMIEIAIALAVIAFALVAIIGVLPTGMTVQKDNREETIINQDGPYFLEAIRTGSRGLDHLTNYVDSITVTSIGTNSGTYVSNTIIYTNAPGLLAPPLDGSMTNGLRIIGLLSMRKFEGDPIDPTNRVTNIISGRIRALTGSATEQGMANPDFAFSYLLVSEVTPFISSQVSTNSTNFNDPGLTTPAQVAQVKAAWVQVKTRETNSSEVRLTFKWPLFQNTNGPNRQSFRALASGSRTNIDGLSFFLPQSFVAVAAP